MKSEKEKPRETFKFPEIRNGPTMVDVSKVRTARKKQGEGPEDFPQRPCFEVRNGPTMVDVSKIRARRNAEPESAEAENE